MNLGFLKDEGHMLIDRYCEITKYRRRTAYKKLARTLGWRDCDAHYGRQNSLEKIVEMNNAMRKLVAKEEAIAEKNTHNVYAPKDVLDRQRVVKCIHTNS